MLYSIPSFLSGACLLLSLACNVMGWMRLNPPGGSWVFALHGGVLILGATLVFHANRTAPRPDRNLDHLYKLVPKWLRRIFWLVLAYAFVNMGWSAKLTSGYAKGSVPFWLELRGFSAWWIAFYSLSLIGFVGLRRFKQNWR